MLRKDVSGVGSASDYVIKASDLSKINNLNNNSVLGLNGCQIEGKYISSLPDEAVELVEPIISLNTIRDSQSGGTLWWMLDEYLGFKSMTSEEYNGSATLRQGANVILYVDSTARNANNLISDDMAAAVKKGTGIIFIGQAKSLNDSLGSGSAAPTTAKFTDVAISGQYNVDSSLFTTNYASTSTYYARGYKYTSLPTGAKVLFQSSVDKDDAFIGGFQATSGEKDTFANAVTMFSTIVTNDGVPAQALVIGQQLDYRPHYQKLLPILATAIFADAAGIYDDQNDPTVETTLSGSKCTIKATEPDSGVAESGIKTMSVYKDNSGTDKLLGEANSGTFTFVPGKEAVTLKVVATDYAGNETTKKFKVDATAGTVEAIEEKAPTSNGTGYVSGRSNGGSNPSDSDFTSAKSTEDIIAGVEATRIKLRTVKAGKGYIKLSWTKSKGYKVDGYQVFRSVKRYSGYGKKAFFTKKTSALTATYKNTKSVKSGTRYYYKVRGYRVIGDETYYTQYSNKCWWTIK
jgi:hypothetical protein